jgi:hypothetical protein
MNNFSFYRDTLNNKNFSYYTGTSINSLTAVSCLDLNQDKLTTWTANAGDLALIFNTLTAIDSVVLCNHNFTSFIINGWTGTAFFSLTAGSGNMVSFATTTVNCIQVVFTGTANGTIGQLMIGKKLFDLNKNPNNLAIKLDFNEKKQNYYNGRLNYRKDFYTYDIDLEYKILQGGYLSITNTDLENLEDLISENRSFVLYTNNDLNVHGYRPDLLKLRSTGDVVYEMVNNGMPNSLQFKAKLRSCYL